MRCATGAPECGDGQLIRVLTAPVSAVPALFATVRARPGPIRPVKTALSGALDGFDGTDRARTRLDGHKQSRNGADGAVRTGR